MTMTTTSVPTRYATVSARIRPDELRAGLPIVDLIVEHVACPPEDLGTACWDETDVGIVDLDADAERELLDVCGRRVAREYHDRYRLRAGATESRAQRHRDRALEILQEIHRKEARRCAS